MVSLLQDLKNNFQDHADIISAVGSRCSFLTESQETETPFITYNVQELQTLDKDGTGDYSLVILVVASNLLDLINIYETAKNVIMETNLIPSFQGSSFPERLKEWDDNYIIDLTINLNK